MRPRDILTTELLFDESLLVIDYYYNDQRYFRKTYSIFFYFMIDRE